MEQLMIQSLRTSNIAVCIVLTKCSYHNTAAQSCSLYLAEHINQSWTTWSSKAQWETPRYRAHYLSKPFLFHITFFLLFSTQMCFWGIDKVLSLSKNGFQMMTMLMRKKKNTVSSIIIIEFRRESALEAVRVSAGFCSIFLPSSGRRAQRTFGKYMS